VRSPTNEKEQDVYTSLTEAYLEEREKAYKDELRASRLFSWLTVIFCVLCFFVCWYGVSTLVEWNRGFNYYIIRETSLSEQRNQREIERFIQDSVIQARREAREIGKDERDSLAWARSIKQMDRYDKLPDYRGE
jgi:hypothetical protein